MATVVQTLPDEGVIVLANPRNEARALAYAEEQGHEHVLLTDYIDTDHVYVMTMPDFLTPDILESWVPPEPEL